MLDKFIYENHLGQRFSGLENGVYLNYSDIRDYSWAHETINSRISRFYRAVTARKLPLVVYGASEAEAVAAKNRLLELAEADIEALLPGRVYVGEYYTTGWITASAKKKYLMSKRLSEITLTLTSDDPAWYREQAHVFLPDSDETSGIGGGTDYPYDYAYDYALSLKGRQIMCDAVGGSAFRLLIYGEAVNPSIVINGHVYAVNGTVRRGETLLIDSMNKTITLTTAAGGKINWFDKRGRESYIFRPIAPGQNTVTWLGAFGFDLTVIEKRSEPKWT